MKTEILVYSFRRMRTCMKRKIALHDTRHIAECRHDTLWNAAPCTGMQRLARFNIFLGPCARRESSSTLNSTTFPIPDCICMYVCMYVYGRQVFLRCDTAIYVSVYYDISVPHRHHPVHLKPCRLCLWFYQDGRSLRKSV